jgi:AhpC/TSA family protein
MRSDIAPGAEFPDYELPDHENVARRLSELQGDDPLILTLARGHYCPKEHQQHLELAAFYPKVAVAYTQIATIATDPHHTLQEFRASVGAQWSFLSEPGPGPQRPRAARRLERGRPLALPWLGQAGRGKRERRLTPTLQQVRVAADQGTGQGSPGRDERERARR